MFHYMLKNNIKELVQVPPRMDENEEDVKQTKINKLRITQAELQIAFLVVCELEWESESSLRQISKNILDIVSMLKKEQPTMAQKWNNIFSSKAKFVLDKEKKVTGQTSIEFMEKLDSNIDTILAYDADLIKGTLLHLGNLAEKVS